MRLSNRPKFKISINCESQLVYLFRFHQLSHLSLASVAPIFWLGCANVPTLHPHCSCRCHCSPSLVLHTSITSTLVSLAIPHSFFSSNPFTRPPIICLLIFCFRSFVTTTIYFNHLDPSRRATRPLFRRERCPLSLISISLSVSPSCCELFAQPFFTLIYYELRISF